MLERIKHVLKNRKQDDKGFSLVELAVVIVIIGILVAIAIPVFNGIQDGAKQARADAAAANGAAIVASNIAGGVAAGQDLPAEASITAPATGTTPTLQNFCVTGSAEGKTATKGPGCTVPTPPAGG